MRCSATRSHVAVTSGDGWRDGEQIVQNERIAEQAVRVSGICVTKSSWSKHRVVDEPAWGLCFGLLNGV